MLAFAGSNVARTQAVVREGRTRITTVAVVTFGYIALFETFWFRGVRATEVWQHTARARQSQPVVEKGVLD